MSDNKKQIEKLPPVEDLIRKLLTRGTGINLSFPSIVFNNPLSPIKSLDVIVSSIETDDVAILHMISARLRRNADV